MVKPEMMLKSVRIKNLLSFKDAIFEDMGQLAINVGRNNSGKSNLFRILRTLKLNSKINQNLIYEGRTFEDVEIELIFKVSENFINEVFEKIYRYNTQIIDLNIPLGFVDETDNPLLCSIAEFFSNFHIKIKIRNYRTYLDYLGFLGEFSNDKHTKREEVRFDDEGKYIHGFEWKLTSMNTRTYYDFREISQKYKDIYGIPLNNLKDQQTNTEETLFFSYYHLLVEYLETKKQYIQDLRYYEKDADIPKYIIDSLEPSGRNIPEIIFNYHNKRNQQERLSKLENIIQKFYPDVTEVGQNIAPGKTVPYIKEKSHDTLRNFEYLGRGMQQLIIIITHLIESKEDSLIMIEEPELFLHPQLQKILMQVFNDFKNKRQIIISTHSPFFFNSGYSDFSVHHIQKQNGCSNVINCNVSELKNIYGDLGVNPSDFLLNNGIIFVEGNEDMKFFSEILGNYLLQENIALIRLNGKYNIPDSKLISSLMRKSFKFLIILDKDEGNEKIKQRIQDQDVRKRILLLPIRELENFYINPSVLNNYLTSEQKDDIESCEISKEIDEIIRELIDESITDNLFNETIERKFLDSQPIPFTRNQKCMLLKNKNIEDWPNCFLEFYKEEYKVKSFNETYYFELFKQISDEYDKKRNDSEKWKHFPGKKMLKFIKKEFENRYSITINVEKLEEYAIESELVKGFVEEIKNKL